MPQYIDENDDAFDMTPAGALFRARAKALNRQLKNNLGAYRRIGGQGPTADEEGTVNSMTDQSLIRRMGQPGEWQGASPATRMAMVEARKRLMVGDRPVANLRQTAMAAAPVMVGRVGPDESAGNVQTYEPGTHSADEARAEALAAMRSRMNTAAKLKAAQIRATNGGKMPSARDKIAARNAATFQRRLDAITSRRMAEAAPQLAAIQLQNQPTARDRLMDAQRQLIQSQLPESSAGAPATPVAPGQPNGGVTVRPPTWWERYKRAFLEARQVPGLAGPQMAPQGF